MADENTEGKKVELKDGPEPKVIQFPPGVHDGQEPEVQPEEEGEPTMQVQDWTIEELNQFITETYRFVNQLHLEHVTLTSILLERGVVTTQELDKMFHEIKMRHEQAMQAQRSKMSQEDGPQDEAPDEDPVAVELDLGNKPIAGRKPPQGHNSGD